ncbi:MAG: phosphoribosylanthranilate isomerase [Desulfobacterales bacterium]
MTPQIKICGLTRADEALKCAELGVNAIGLIFYDKSPRFLSDVQAIKICDALPDTVKKIGVFVDKSFIHIMGKVKKCGLTGVQLHGQETPELVDCLVRENLLVIKGLFTSKRPNILEVCRFNASAYLVECGKGKLPGGNAMVWNWSQALDFGKTNPFLLAGGLSPDNVVCAIKKSFPDAVDVSSGVEISPGRKDIRKVEDFIKAVHGVSEKYMLHKKKPRNIFCS